MSAAALMNTTTNQIAASRLWRFASSSTATPFSSIYNVTNGNPINGVPGHADPVVQP